MDIHLPEGKIESIRDFLTHLFTITCGILIALSLEAGLEALHHHHMVNEARAQILTELRDNQQSLQNTLDRVPPEEKNLKNIMALASEEIKKRGSVRLDESKAISLGFSYSNLSRISWETAQSSGALALMPYEEVKRYTRIYDLQNDVATLQGQVLNKWLETERVATLLDPKAQDFSYLSLADVLEIRHSASEAAIYTDALQSIGSGLGNLYKKELDKP